METTENKNSQKTIQKILYILVFLLLAIFLITNFILFFYQKTQNKNLSQKKQTNVEIVSPKIEEKSIKIEKTQGEILISSAKTKYLVGEKIEIDVKANLENEDIVGYDLIFSYNPQGVDYLSANSLIPSFSVYTYKKDNKVFLTGVKNPQTKESIIFKNNSILKLIFQAKNQGVYKIDIISKDGPSKTKLVNINTKEFYPQLSSVAIEVK